VVDQDIYEIMKQYPQYFDTSEMDPKNSFGLLLRNKKVTGLFKDEGKGKVCSRFICLRPKAYVVEFEDDDLIRKLKSVSKRVTRTLEFQDYYKVFSEKTTLYSKMIRIVSKDHQIFTVEVNKKSMSGDDDKRFILEDGIQTLAWGHKDIKVENKI
jgi:hypothetical protein